jgi:hypothetical protein
MAQLSPSTSIFDQVATSLSSIAEKLKSGKYITKQDLISDFNQALTEAYQNIDSFNTKLDLFAKGEPPTSTKMNKFVNSLKNDINISAKQLDYLTAKTISIFNLFTSEIENEKKYSQRIFSKTKILQMYSSSPAEDIVYIGDSFDNQDYMDFSKMKVNENPMILNGAGTIQASKTTNWNPSRIIMNNSNGFMGNNHIVIKSKDELDQINYEYAFKNSPSISNPLNIIDKNPLTYFEYEALNIDKSKYQSIFDFIPSDNEFSYIVDSEELSSAPKRSLVNWSNHNLQKPLLLDFTIEGNGPAMANSVKISPYFGYTKIVKVSNIYVTNDMGETEDVVKESFYIGLSPESLTKEAFSKYYFNSAIVNFSDRKVLKVRVVLEQPYFNEEEIMHTYWATDYSQSTSDNSPFFGSVRFNPDSLSKDIYQEINYNKDAIIPPLSNPNIFKKNNITSKQVTVSVKKKITDINKAESVQTFSVPLKLKRDIIKCKRMSIGLRDISIEYIEYLDSAEIVSLPYNFDYPVESVMLGIDSDLNSVSSSTQLISSSISVDNGNSWIDISSSQFGFNSASSSANPEVLVFNQNVPPGYKLPGVGYQNYPKVPSEIRSILVKIKMLKDPNTNVVPTVYSYTLAAKVKKI